MNSGFFLKQIRTPAMIPIEFEDCFSILFLFVFFAYGYWRVKWTFSLIIPISHFLTLESCFLKRCDASANTRTTGCVLCCNDRFACYSIAYSYYSWLTPLSVLASSFWLLMYLKTLAHTGSHSRPPSLFFSLSLSLPIFFYFPCFFVSTVFSFLGGFCRQCLDTP